MGQNNIVFQTKFIKYFLQIQRTFIYNKHIFAQNRFQFSFEFSQIKKKRFSLECNMTNNLL